LELGRVGKPTNDHAYLSAVVLLCRRELALDARDEILAELRKRYDGEATTAEERQHRAVAVIEELERHDLPDGHYFCVEVIETLSQEAVPLPDNWFSGERDRRWRCNDEDFVDRADLGPNRGWIERDPNPHVGLRSAKRRGWDSNPRAPLRGPTVFETAPFNHSGTPPGIGPGG
jgi:hypothetical protein